MYPAKLTENEIKLAYLLNRKGVCLSVIARTLGNVTRQALQQRFAKLRLPVLPEYRERTLTCATCGAMFKRESLEPNRPVYCTLSCYRNRKKGPKSVTVV